jgi:hypothetical protein
VGLAVDLQGDCAHTARVRLGARRGQVP